jgi:hypothetical protein
VNGAPTSGDLSRPERRLRALGLFGSRENTIRLVAVSIIIADVALNQAGINLQTYNHGDLSLCFKALILYR